MLSGIGSAAMGKLAFPSDVEVALYLLLVSALTFLSNFLNVLSFKIMEANKIGVISTGSSIIAAFASQVREAFSDFRQGLQALSCRLSSSTTFPTPGRGLAACW